jgi:hypothetical protein
MPLIRRLLRSSLVRGQRGFTTVTMMGALSVGGLMVVGGFAAVNPDIGLSRDDQDYKQAYGAAEAGAQWYISSLARDNDYYIQCTDVLDPNATEQAPVNDRWDGTGTDPRIWRDLPGGEAEYAVELLPAAGYDACVEGDQYSMVDSSGNLRLRVTGRSREETRSIIVTLRRRNFLDFIYFTHFETLDPLAYSSSSTRAWAQTACARFRAQRSGSCTEIQFAPTDVVDGPLHTNDSIWVCGTPTFGRDSKDSIELNGEAPGYEEADGCDSSPTAPDFEGTVVQPAGQMELPESNLELKNIADTDYVFKGRTRITFEGDSMDVIKKNGSEVTMDLPANGVIYVQNDGNCSTGYARSQVYNSPSACGDVWVKGTYSADMTIAGDNDVIIDGNLLRDEDDEGLLLGLIANNFVRVYHPVTNPSSSSCANSSGALQDPVIEAAILALNHSFIVDNWYCGETLGDLNVVGAISQRFRGPVGQSGTSPNGYIKTYEYNDRLRFREPPFFMDPVASAWRVARQNEQVPATK